MVFQINIFLVSKCNNFINIGTELFLDRFFKKNQSFKIQCGEST